MEYQKVRKEIKGKEVIIQVKEQNKPNIELMANGIMEATKNIKGC